MTTNTLHLVQNILNSVPCHIFWKDRDSVFLGCNLLFANFVGFDSCEEVIGKTDYDLNWKNYAKKIIENDETVLQENRSIIFDEMGFISKKSPLKDKHGNIIGIVGFSIFKKEYYEFFYTELNILDQIISVMPGHVYWENKDSILLGCNEQQARDIGFNSRDEIIGKNPYFLLEPFLSPEVRDKEIATIMQVDQEVMKSNIARILEEPMTSASGDEVVYLSHKVPLHDKQEEVIGLVGISFDITKQKKQERALAQAKQNEEDLRKAAMIFAGSIAHDLTTPLTNINLMANNVSNMLPELLKIYQTIETYKQNLNEKQLAYLENFPQSLQTQLTELNEYIKDSLKALNKTVAGIKTQDDLVKCELWRCMQKVIDEYPYLENEKDLIHWDTSYLFNFMGNPLLFYRIMFNLIKNSLYQIREKGRGEIFIRAVQTDTHNVLYFKDTAGGVTQDVVDNIFNSYQTTKAEGTGVGLAFCKLTMQSFGGEMDCRLVDGEFIEFSLKFKLLL